MNSVTGYIIICMLLLSSLIFLIVLLITVTEKPDMFFEEPYGKIYPQTKKNNSPKSEKFYQKYNKTTSATTKNVLLQESIISQNDKIIELTTKSFKNDTKKPINNFDEIFIKQKMNISLNSAEYYNTKYIGIIIDCDEVLIPKNNGEIEIFKESDDGLFKKISNKSMQINKNKTIDKMRRLDKNFYTTNFNSKTISKFNFNGNLMKEIKINSEITDMNAFGTEVSLNVKIKCFFSYLL